MARRFQEITEVYRQELAALARGDKWTAFLRSACRNYKLHFEEQVLVHAQRPDATAVLEMAHWNRRFDRWVDPGSTGIAGFDRDTPGRARLKYYFDISDTHEGRFHRPVPLWQVSAEQEPELVEALEHRFGALAQKEMLGDAIVSAMGNAVTDNMVDYLADLQQSRDGSFLEELDELNVKVLYRRLLENSTAYMLLCRCGLEPDAYFEPEDFSEVFNFNTPETLNALGVATRDIAESGLSAIALTVRSRQKQIRTIAQAPGNEYPIDKQTETQTERSENHGTDIHDEGRLPAAGSAAAAGAGNSPWEIRPATPEVSEGAPEGAVHEPADIGQAERASGGDRPDGAAARGTDGDGDGSGRGRDGGAEGQRSDEVGVPDEQHPGSSGGSGTDRAGLRGHISGPLIAGEELPQAPVDGTSATAGLQNSHHDFNARTDIPYYHEDSEKQELLRISDALKDHRTEIAAFFEAHEGRKERGDFIKGFFDNTYVEKILSNGQRAGYRAWDDVLNLWRGTYLSREKEEFLRWPHVADTIYGMILLHQWLDPDERPLPSEAEQVSLIEQAEAEKASAFILPQEAIDYVLCGRYSPSKLRIYDQYQKQESRQENAKFLKAEYGVGSYSNAIPSSGFRVDHDSTGITISRDYGDPDGKFLLTWAKVEKRIGELIAAGRYLNRAEREHYPQYRAQVEQRKARWDIAAEISSINDDIFKT